MKKCPNCQKEFPDSMRFCQTDGTPLVEFVEETPAEDPLKTTVVRQEDFASSIPPSDPFKTMVGSSLENKEEEGDEDVLQLPEEFDPLKTMVAPPSQGQDKPILEDIAEESPKFDEIKEEIKSETPFTPPGDFSAPVEPPIGDPEPPKFEEPSISPPDFSDFSLQEEKKSDFDATLIQNPFHAGRLSGSDAISSSQESSEPRESFSDSPFSKPNESLETPSFKEDIDPRAETEVKPTYDSPSSPFDSPSSPFSQSSSPFDAPQSSSTEDEPPATQFQPMSFDPPKTQFQEPEKPFDAGIKFGQTNEPQFGSQPLQAAEWNPPPAPDSSWQNQGIGQNTPFQPPPAMAGQNQTLPIVSLILGICSVCCYITLLTGPAALITGYLGMKNANENPQEYGGKGLAIAGMIVGGVLFALVLLYVVFWLLVWFGLVGASIFGSM